MGLGYLPGGSVRVSSRSKNGSAAPGPGRAGDSKRSCRLPAGAPSETSREGSPWGAGEFRESESRTPAGLRAPSLQDSGLTSNVSSITNSFLVALPPKRRRLFLYPFHRMEWTRFRGRGHTWGYVTSTGCRLTVTDSFVVLRWV